jgi:hypothetical protein
MLKKCLIPCAKVVETGLALRSADKTIARALSVASESNFAFTAITRQSIAFGVAECPLLIRCNELHHVLLLDVPQAELGLHKVITGIKIAVMLQGQRRGSGQCSWRHHHRIAWTLRSGESLHSRKWIAIHLRTLLNDGTTLVGSGPAQTVLDFSGAR